MRDAISAEKRLAVTMYWLASGDLFRTVADLFGISEGSVCVIIHGVCKAIVDVLLPQYIRWPTGERLRANIRGYEEVRNFPQCGGAIDGTHIPVRAPAGEGPDFHNRKGWYSMLLQGTVDYLYSPHPFRTRFTDISIGFPGSVHDARVLRKSDIFKRGDRGTLFPQVFFVLLCVWQDLTKEIDGVQVPVMLLGDPAYPLLPWLMKGYADNGRLDRAKTHFNFRLSSARMTVECAFGRLKGRWRCLAKRLDVDVGRVPQIVGVCCTLHNICEIHGEGFDMEWFFHDVVRQRAQLPQVEEAAPNDARDAICRRFALEEQGR
ncbi:protein ANTAGONIST OF LIKE HETEROCHROMATIN PROTEIN 1-like [Branchiostoma floridae]|uniref:Protein ANTAGONIST OF LIKE HETEROCHROMATIN PROTEIN 1-like n=1 Tax=Branchiostoma floridae TaxID=7739 RepID=A0A9J7MPW5_BRAFL|nr:protein ANTAGONIST OF LIKE HETEROCHROMATIN PROTEIN 1-like [Branchiostoma floridae]